MPNINGFPLVVFGKWTLAENFNINVCTHLSRFRDVSQVIYNTCISSLEIYKTKEYLHMTLCGDNLLYEEASLKKSG
jgi:hypothetical protein